MQDLWYGVQDEVRLIPVCHILYVLLLVMVSTGLVYWLLMFCCNEMVLYYFETEKNNGINPRIICPSYRL